MRLFRKLLFPFNPIYYTITWVRNTLYNTNILTSKIYDFPLICVGNLSTGGTGKTPMVEYLISLLKDNYNVATLSRGYKRSTKGFVIADDYATAQTIGDEPYQFYRKFKNAIQVAVDANRQSGIARLRELQPQPEVIILDDAFQHRKVQAGYTILLTTYSNLYSDDWILPSGDLREPKNGAKRANCIIVTKCPETISEEEKLKIKNKLKPKINQKLFFSWIVYSDEIISEEKTMSLKACTNFTLVTGIANAKPLVNHLKRNQLDFNHLEYSDHYAFSASDIAKINESNLIITTEKDYVRLQSNAQLKSKLFYLPIKIHIDKAGSLESNLKSFISLF